MELTFEVTLDYGDGPAEDEPSPTEDDVAKFVVDGLAAAAAFPSPAAVKVVLL